jgi:undecaprenyl-diphosphatase
MPDWLVVTILGIIEGITEFIPVSSTGHLLIAEHWLPRQSDLFNIVIQCGAVLAVLPLFRDRLAMLARWREPESQHLIGKITVAFVLTAVGGLVLDKLDFTLPETVPPVASALIIGGIIFIFVEQHRKGRPLDEQVTWTVAIAVGVAQLAAAVFPGLSRSGGTIIFALLLGTGRVAATEFSFLVGIPTLLVAGAWKTLKYFRHPDPNGVHEDWALLGLAGAVAAVVSFIAVKWLLRYVQSHTFHGFGYYRIALGIVLLAWLAYMPH